MRFAPPRLVLLLSLAVGGLMYFADALLAPRANLPNRDPIAAAITETPTLQLWAHASCCTDCVVAFARPLLGIDGLGDPRLVPAAVGASTAAFIRFDVPIIDPARFDFAVVRAALADAGFALEHAHLSGLSHYRIEASLPRLTDPTCAPTTRASMEATIAAARPRGYFRWYDSLAVQPGKAVFYPRYGTSVDLVEIEGVLERVGFVSRSLTVHAGD